MGRSLLIEYIGSFFLVLVYGMTLIEPGAGDLAPIAIGCALMAMIYAGSNISGGHYNPAVTVAVWLRGRIEASDVVPYMLAQVAGAMTASLAVVFFKGNPVVTPMDVDAGKAILNEMAFTFGLVLVFLSAMPSKTTPGNSYHGLATGLMLVAGLFAGGSISGGAFNPAVAAGFSIMGLTAPGSIWIFLLGNFAGGALAAGAFRALHPVES